MYFLSNIFQGFKIFVGSIGGIASIIGIGIGIAHGNIPLIIISSLFTAESLIVLGDNTKALQDLKEYVNKMKWEVNSLHNEVYRLNLTTDKLQKLNDNINNDYKKLEKLFNDGKKSIDELNRISLYYKGSYDELKNKVSELQVIKDGLSDKTTTLESLIKKAGMQSAVLKWNAVVIRNANTKFKEENNRLKTLVDETEHHLQILKESTDQYKLENQHLEGQLNELKDETTELKLIRDNLKKNNENLKVLNEQANSYIDALRKASTSMNTTEVHLQETTQQLVNAVNTLEDKNNLFDHSNVELQNTQNELQSITETLKQYIAMLKLPIMK